MPRKNKKNSALSKTVSSPTLFKEAPKVRERAPTNQLKLQYHIEQDQLTPKEIAIRWFLQDEYKIFISSFNKKISAIIAFEKLSNEYNNPKLVFLNTTTKNLNERGWHLLTRENIRKNKLEPIKISEISELSDLAKELENYSHNELNEQNKNYIIQKLLGYFGENTHQGNLDIGPYDTPFFDILHLDNHKKISQKPTMTISIFAFPTNEDFSQTDYERTYTTYEKQHGPTIKKIDHIGKKKIYFDMRYFIGTFTVNKTEIQLDENGIPMQALNPHCFINLPELILSNEKQTDQINKHFPELLEILAPSEISNDNSQGFGNSN